MTHPFFARRVSGPHAFVIGHRGSAGTHPENTLASFEAALAAGAQILETDLHCTAEGVPVLCHDPDVDRTTDGAGPIASLSLWELQQLDAGFSYVTASGERPFRGVGVRIPSLEEALSTFPEARFNVEVKAMTEGLCDTLIDVIQALHAEERVLLTAGEGEVMDVLRPRLRARDCAVAQGASTPDVVSFLSAALGRGEAPEGPMALQVPAEFLGEPLVTEEFVDFAHVKGLEVHVWTINEADECARLLDLGVDGIVTDFPGRLAEQLRDRSESA